MIRDSQALLCPGQPLCTLRFVRVDLSAGWAALRKGCIKLVLKAAWSPERPTLDPFHPWCQMMGHWEREREQDEKEGWRLSQKPGQVGNKALGAFCFWVTSGFRKTRSANHLCWRLSSMWGQEWVLISVIHLLRSCLRQFWDQSNFPEGASGKWGWKRTKTKLVINDNFSF